jgi:2-polyprenyl-3-methyl-5-hydroxy-6-metoxy-1,4-benzoquinol methylase
MIRKYVDNWSSVLLVYSNLKRSVTVKFKDGDTAKLSKNDYHAFYEKLYRKHLEDNGFSYLADNMIKTPDGLTLMLPPNTVYSLVFDEIYLMQVYGKPNLTGKVVIDVGAAIGDTALFFKKCGAKAVYGYEVDKARVRIAEKNIELNGMGHCVVIYNKKATVEELQKLMATINDSIFLKLDCEGCEYDIIPKLDMEKVTDVVMEYHMKPEPLMEALARAGFSDIHLNRKAVMITAS